MYTIDHDGIGGQWRVWWIGPTGHTIERLFRTAEAAQAWVDFMESLSVDFIESHTPAPRNTARRPSEEFRQ